MAAEIRSIGPDDLMELGRVVYTAFGEVATEEIVEHERITVEYDRMLGVADEGRLVAGAGAYSFDLSLPGHEAIPVAGVTWVGVLPTHRRRGVLTAMMNHQLGDVVERGEALAVLTASEAVIYGRFGYGVASQAKNVEIPTSRGEFRVPPTAGGTCRYVWGDDAAAALPPVYDAWRRQRPGAISRNDAFWKSILEDKEWTRGGFSAAQWVLHEAPGGQPDGYVRYRVKEATGGHDGNTARVIEVIAIDREVEAAMWRFVLDLDLTATVEGRYQPVDDPLHWRLADSRAYHVKDLYDWLWVRVLDTPAALTARRYATEGSLVLEVVDSFRPDGHAAGRFALDAGLDGATCKRLDAAGPDPDITLPVDALGAAYLGGVRFTTLAAAGRVSGSHDTLQRADALFASTPMPFCNTGF